MALDYEDRQPLECDSYSAVPDKCALPSCHMYAAEGSELCAAHELEDAIDNNDLEAIAFWKEAA
jgi:hypothetical protein